MTTERKYYPGGQLKSECQLLNGTKHGKFILYFENGQIAIESGYDNGKSSGTWKEWYQNGQLAEEGEYINSQYHVKNFWDENGQQLLINGTGKTIRKFGSVLGEIYEQYFVDGEYKGEKKIAAVSYGKFIPGEQP